MSIQAPGQLRARWITAVALGAMVALSASTTASASSPRTEHCVAPNGVDMNAYLDLSAAIVAPFCPEIKAGAWWVRARFYASATTWEQMPEGYVPAGSTPREDFVAKFLAVRYVVDEGTPDEFTVEFANGPRLWTGDHATDPDIALATPMTLGAIRPLSVGPHTVRDVWIMSDMQCDGWSAVVEESCIPGAGPYDLGTISFEVVAK